jgi:putative nucleotidyltransferase with HDIG domain
MSLVSVQSGSSAVAPAVGHRPSVASGAAELLERTFGVPFGFANAATGEWLCSAPGQPQVDWPARPELCRQVASWGRPELIAEEDPLLVLAIPLAGAAGESTVAVGLFVAREVAPQECLAQAARALGMSDQEASDWAARQVPWPAEALRRTSQLLWAHWSSQRRIRMLEAEASELCVQITSTYEEISLLHRLTQHLKISESDEELGRIVLGWMEEVLPARGMAIELLPTAESNQSLGHVIRRQPVLLTHGHCPVDHGEFARLIAHLAPGEKGQPVVVNRPLSERPDWPCAQVRQVIAVPLAEGKNLFGWLAAFNQVTDDEFGTVEANLLGSVAAILGIHSGNLALYRRQAEMTAGVIRALTAAIDAKDQYTCGHSDRVARIAVRLAEELRCDEATLNTIYLSGLLHDIGKIGVSDSVLRKPGGLTADEYEHIKRHTEIGHKILRDLKQLDDVLPVILHHHESWDGAGYPARLREEEIPLAARIVAVADSFDAMGSHRPYRAGMPDQRIDAIFREGAGRQWDSRVVEAFFRVRDDVRRIAAEEPSNADGEVPRGKSTG